MAYGSKKTKPPASLDAVLSDAEAYTQINTDDN